MKYLKAILVLIIFGATFVACEKNEVSYAFQEISAPTKVTAVFDIAQDDSGTVVVTPSGEGAQSFNVYFGDVEDEEPEVVTPGGSLEHVYGEGEYQVRVVGVGSTALTSEFTQVITISFSAPENLEVTIDQSDPNPKLVKVSAKADNATMFDVYWGDVEDEEPTPLMPDDVAEHIYAEAGDYTIRVVAVGAGSETLEYSEEITIGDAEGAMELPITFDDPTVNYAFGTFNGTTFEVVDNPDESGANDTASKVGAITNSGVNWEGIAATLGTPVDFSGDNKTIMMKFWSEVELPVLLKFEDGVDDARQTEVTATHGGTGWETLSFNFATDAIKSYIDGTQGAGEPFVPTGQYNTIVIFVDGPGQTAGTFYLDDIEQEALDLNCVAEMDENIDPANGDINWTFKTKDFDHTFEPFGNIASEIVDNPNPTGINESCNVQQYVKTAGCETWSGVGKGLANAIDLTTSPNKVFKLMVYGEAKTTTVTLQLEFEPFPNTDPLVAINQEMTKVGEWEELTFDFSEHTDKTFKSIIVYFDRDNTCDDAVYYFDNLVQVEGGGSGPAPQEPTEAAPAPTEDEANVTSVYSDSYTDVAGTDFYPNWGQTSTFEEVDFNGNKAIKYANLNYQGISLGSQVDATVYETIHIDVWSNDYTSVPFFLISAGSGEKSVALNLSPNQWNSIDIPLSEFTDQGLSVNDIFQFKFDVQPDTGGAIYIDNIYFYKSGGSSPSGPTMAAPTPGQDASDVTSVFSDAYTDVAGTDFFPNWGQSTTYEQVDLMGDAAIKYSNMNYQGISLGENVDASVYQTVHIDVWSDDYTSVPFFLISAGSGEKSVALSLSPNQWNSIDIPLSEFTDQGLAVNDIFQFKFDVQPDNGGTIYIDNLYFYGKDSGGAAGKLELPISFDDPTVTYEFGTFNGASYEVVDNPDPSGANPTVSKVGAITNSGGPWEGGLFNLETAVDFSGSNKTITIKFWSNVATPLLLKFEGGVNGERQNEVVANHGGTGWETISFDFASDAIKSYIDGSQGAGEPFVPTGQYASLVLFVDGPGNTAGTFYMDDIIQE
ncbi:hypothetical protein [Lutimonas zeaxanthinifaciens]|uniref:hypothetical protein n=1 Tax=Lutimonas zeaxanthinifaciens TaxID=3060215 RepID=UPI00265CECD3|nr:hypothetical protein [Lutimonas sp. YSD2104]WKK65127.1 hypothetical protein QZH61_11110 [Lutimonas sp. YSD2104]